MKFDNCISLKTIPNGFFNTTNVTNLYDCFKSCTSLNENWLLIERRKKMDKIYEKIKSHRDDH